MEELNNPENLPTEDVLVLEDVPVVLDNTDPVIEEPQHVETVEHVEPTLTPTHEPLQIDNDGVLLYSEKDFVSISKGFSKVDKVLAEKLLKNKNVRLATQEEIKNYFNK